MSENDRKQALSEGFKLGQGKPTIWEGFQWIKWDAVSLDTISEIPCAGAAILTGVFGGLLLGISRRLVSRSNKSAINWGFGSMVVSTTISWEFCRYQRKVSQQSLAMMAEAQRQNKT